MGKINFIKKIKTKIQDTRFWIKLFKNIYLGFKETIHETFPCC